MQYIDKTVDVPVVRQGQVFTIETVQKNVEVPQVSIPGSSGGCSCRAKTGAMPVDAARANPVAHC